MTKEQWLNQIIPFDEWGRPPSLADVPLTYGARKKAFKLMKIAKAAKGIYSVISKNDYIMSM